MEGGRILVAVWPVVDAACLLLDHLMFMRCSQAQSPWKQQRVRRLIMYSSCEEKSAPSDSPLLEDEKGLLHQQRWSSPSLCVWATTAATMLVGTLLIALSQPVWHPAIQQSAQLDSATYLDQPNIVYILADDLAYFDVSAEHHQYSQATSYLSSLMYDGVRFTNHYAMHMCTPSRAALLTGKYPSNTGMHKSVIDADAQWGLPVSLTLLPEYLKKAGYDTAMIGKWHLGHHTEEFLPHRRGFDYFFGFLTGTEFYYEHKHTREINGTYWYDLLRATPDSGYKPIGGIEYTGRYSSLMHLHEIDTLLSSRSQDQPLFLYLAPQNVHGPLDEPPSTEYTDAHLAVIDSFKANAFQMNYVKSLIWLDKYVEGVIESLTSNGYLKNTIIIFASDNGGCYYGGGFNIPYRGAKGTLYEGGIRTNAFVWSVNSELLPDNRRGKTHTGLFHISDWFPTILSLAGAELVDGIDGIDQSATIFTHTETYPREEMLINTHTHDDLVSSKAYRWKQYKLIYSYSHIGYYSPDATPFDEAMDPAFATIDCLSVPSGPDYRRMLFDIDEDPYETTDIIKSQHVPEGVVEYLELKLREYSRIARQECAVEIDEGAETTIVDTWERAGGVIVPWSYDSQQQCDV